VHDRCLQDLALLFQGLNLQGSSQQSNIAEHVYAKSLADDLSDVLLPAVLVTTEGGEELLEQESVENRAWGYPCAVLLVDNAAPTNPDIRPDLLSWRHSLMVAVDEAPARSTRVLASTPECWTLSLRPRSVFEKRSRSGNSGLPSYMLLVSSFVVICHVNEARNRS